MRMTAISDLRQRYGLPGPLWQSFVNVAGNPGEDLRLLAVLPPHVVSAALERAQLEDGSFLTAVQASHVGLVYSLAKRIQHTRGGHGNRLSEGTAIAEPGDTMVTTTPTAPSSERKLKMTQILDQNDDGEFTVQNEEARARWYQQYIAVVGGWPLEEEEPTMEQLSALEKRLQVQDIAPYRGLRHLRTLLSKGFESIKVQDIH